jgi:hypothetical protein
MDIQKAIRKNNDAVAALDKIAIIFADRKTN